MTKSTHSKLSSGSRILGVVAVMLTMAVLTAPAVAADKYIPGVTDFPSYTSDPSGGDERYIPGVTDFPSYAHPSSASAAVAANPADRFDWIDAGVGAAVALMLGAVFGILLLAVRRRTGLTTA